MKTKHPARKSRATQPETSAFEQELIASVGGLLDTLKSGKAHTLRSTTIELPEPLPVRSAREVRALRDRLGVSQAVFARLLNVPLVTVSSWENGQRKPSGAALKLLDVAEHHPAALGVTLARKTRAPVSTLKTAARSPAPASA